MVQRFVEHGLKGLTGSDEATFETWSGKKKLLGEGTNDLLPHPTLQSMQPEVFVTAVGRPVSNSKVLSVGNSVVI